MGCPPPSTLFPYTTLFRSAILQQLRPPAQAATAIPPCGPSNRFSTTSPKDASPKPSLEVTTPTHSKGKCWIGGQISGSPTRKCRSEEHTSELQSRFDLVCR